MKGKTDINAQIGKRVKQAREAAELTQERLAELTDITPQYLSSVERGTVGLSVPILMRLCSVLSVSSDFILVGETTQADVTGVAQRLSRLPQKHARNAERILNAYMEGIAITQQDE